MKNMDSNIKLETPTKSELDAWFYNLDHQMKNTDHISSIWVEGFNKMKDVITQGPTVFENLTIPHWRILPIDGKSEDFFDRLSKSIFNTNIYLRKWEERDYLPTRCRWHDTFGHLPFLYNEEYSSLLRQMGMLGKMIIKEFQNNKTHRVISLNRLSRLYWYTVEFGLIEEKGKIKALGAGIISSPAELNHSVITTAASSKIKEFDLFEVVRNDYEVYDFQHTYFVIKDLRQIQQAIISLYRMIF